MSTDPLTRIFGGKMTLNSCYRIFSITGDRFVDSLPFHNTGIQNNLRLIRANAD